MGRWRFFCELFVISNTLCVKNSLHYCDFEKLLAYSPYLNVINFEFQVLNPEMNVQIGATWERVKWPSVIEMPIVCFWLKPMATNADVKMDTAVMEIMEIVPITAKISAEMRAFV